MRRPVGRPRAAQQYHGHPEGKSPNLGAEWQLGDLPVANPPLRPLSPPRSPLSRPRPLAALRAALALPVALGGAVETSRASTTVRHEQRLDPPPQGARLSASFKTIGGAFQFRKGSFPIWELPDVGGVSLVHCFLR